VSQKSDFAHNLILLQGEKAASLDFATADFTSDSFFPHDRSASDAAPLIHGFIASNRVSDLMIQVKYKIIQKLVPGLRKEGYTEVPEEEAPTTASASQPRNAQPPPARPQPQAPPERPEYAQQPYSHIPPQNPLEIGRRDLDPFAGVANPFAPPPLFPGAGGDGMFVGPDHPIFGGRGGQGRGGPPQGPWGGDGFLPPMGAPPGARFDPVGPLPMPGRGPFGGGNRPPRGGIGGPDNDEFMPPGFVSVFDIKDGQHLLMIVVIG
jgi:proteasome inhibitor subunit 1 (PI31)